MSNDSKGTKNWFARHKILTGIGAVVIFFIFIGTISGGSDTSTSTNSTNTPTDSQQANEVKEERIKVTATEFYSAYAANEISADAKYKNQKLEITGVVSGIGKDILDTPYVTLDVGELINNVQCMLSPEAVEQASQLSDGDQVTLYGEKPSFLINVIVKKCTIAE